MEGRNLSKSGGGLSNLIVPTQANEPQPKERQPEKREPENEVLVKTFNILSKDYEDLKRYAHYRSFKDNEKFTHKDVLNEAMELLRKKHKEAFD